MNLDTVETIAVILSFVFAAICFGTQHQLTQYEKLCRIEWVSKMVDAAILNGTIRQIEETHRLMDSADAHINLIEDEWQKGLDARNSEK